jgi:cytochrome c553
MNMIEVSRGVAGRAAAIGATVAMTFWAGSLLAQPLTGDPKMGVQRSTMCSGCHGISGLRNAYPEVFRIPMLGNQHPEYISSALQAYRSGERTHSTMRAIASALTDQAIADLAAYYGQGGMSGEGAKK